MSRWNQCSSWLYRWEVDSQDEATESQLETQVEVLPLRMRISSGPGLSSVLRLVMILEG